MTYNGLDDYRTYLKHGITTQNRNGDPEKQTTPLSAKAAVWFLAAASAVTNLALSIGGFYNYNFDSWYHMFFASHYMNSWFNMWEPRWFGGFSVASYPPLVTQVLALGGWVIGLPNAYVVLSLILMTILPVVMFLFASNFLSRWQAVGAGIMTLLFPGIYLSNYTYGQLPTMFALVASLLMGNFLWHYLDTGRFRDMLAAALSTGITIAAHHYTFICLTPAILAVVVVTYCINNRPQFTTLVGRLTIFTAVSLPLVIIPVIPFWDYVLHAPDQTPIFHLSRANFFVDTSALLKFGIAPYLLYLFMIPFVALTVTKDKRLIPLAAVFLLFFLLGLGGTTPLPRLIFGRWWEWLTYDRFSLWAGILLILLLARLIPEPIFFTLRRLSNPAAYLIAALLIIQAAGCAYFASEPYRRSFLPSPPQIEMGTLVGFLAHDDVKECRYLTLGFSEPNMEKLGTLTSAQNIDGVWIPGRDIEILNHSGVALLDSSKFSAAGLEVLDKILANAAQYNLKWVLVNDMFYEDILQRNGFEKIFSDEISRESPLGAVTIWTKDAIPAIPESDKEEKGLRAVIWGTGPLVLLTLFIVTLVTKKGSS